MARTLLMVGTRKGLWIGTSDEARTAWEWSGPHFPMEEVYSVLDRPARRHPAPLRGCVVELARPAGLALGRPRRLVAGDPQRRDPLPRGRDVARRQPGHPGARLAAGAGRRGRRRVGRHRAGRDLPLDRPRRDLRPGARALGPPAPRRSGTRASAGRRSTRSCRTRPTATRCSRRSRPAASTARPTAATRGPRPTPGSRRSSIPGERNYPEFGQCVHKVARDAAEPDRLFLQNHGGVYRSDDGGASWQDIAPGLPSEFGFAMVTHPREANTAYTFPIADAGAPLAGRRQGPRLPYDGRRRHAGSRSARARLPDELLRRGHARRDVRRRPRAGGPLLRRPQRRRLGLGRRGRDLAARSHEDLPDVMFVRAAVTST